MKPTLHRVLRILAVAFYLAVSSHSAGAGPSQNSPEIVRLSYAEGDIRVSEGSSGKVTLDGPWSVAAAGLPIERGFTIATGTGRAEIEFESGWTIYLADNSTLEFTDLNVRNNVPDSKIVLLAGTLSVYFKPAEDEKLSLETPFAKALLTTPESFRVESFLDALSVTSLETSGTKVDADQNPDVFLEKGQTIVYTEGLHASKRARSRGECGAESFGARESYSRPGGSVQRWKVLRLRTFRQVLGACFRPKYCQLDRTIDSGSNRAIERFLHWWSAGWPATRSPKFGEAQILHPALSKSGLFRNFANCQDRPGDGQGTDSGNIF
jgi:hypothetical protein